MSAEGPIRSCVACRVRRPQSALLRVVRSPEGLVVAEGRCRPSGRGAYLCPDEACLTRAERQGRLGRALRTEVPSSCWEQLREAARAVVAKG